MTLDSRGLSGPDLSWIQATRRPLGTSTSSNYLAHIGSTTNRASMGFAAPTASSSKSSDQHRVSKPGCAAPTGFLSLLTPYSAPALLALFHARSAHGVEALRGFPLPVAATAFTARCPSSSSCLRYGTKLWRRSEERHVGNARENDTSAPLRRTTPRHRPESLAVQPPRRKSTKRPNQRPRSSGIHAPGRSVRGEVVLPNNRRPCLSQPLVVPFKDLSLQASALHVAGPPLMGLFSAMDKSNAENALQSVKELEGRLVSLENCRPPWGFRPENYLTLIG
jgi:hypothetical protein